MMKFIIFFLLFSIVVEKVVAQDERYYRDLFLKRDDQLDAKKETVYDIRARTPLYQFDLNGDGIKEGIVFEKAGGESNLHIYSHTKKLLRKYSFDEKDIERLIEKGVKNILLNSSAHSLEKIS